MNENPGSIKIRLNPAPPAASGRAEEAPPRSASSGGTPPARPLAQAPLAPAAPGGPYRTRVRVRRGPRAAAVLLLAAAALTLTALAIGLRSERAPGARPSPAPVQLRVPPRVEPRIAAPPAAQPLPAPAKTLISVYLSKSGAVEKLPLEDYVAGVIAAEMPASFELEALKAQAVAARTFILRRLTDGDVSGVPGGQAMVTDTVAHQAYVSREKLMKWKTEGEADKLAKIQQAVKDTQGLVMTYEGKPITASFFSASGGYTENSEDYWNVKVPYLRSVPSPWDAELDPGYKQTVTLSIGELYRTLGLGEPAVSAVAAAKEDLSSMCVIVSSTPGHRVKEAKIGGVSFTGREIREKLRLRSSQFKFGLDAGKIKITTYGYGHGVGMSQWGANGMAQRGSTFTQILNHYYTGITFSQAAVLLKA